MTSSPPPLHHHQINTTAIAIAIADDNSAPAATTTLHTPWSSETNWTVSRGSLDTAVTFESFDFPIESESIAPKPPLLLVPPSSCDFEPCEIKINFTHKHEIRQVYVRSTARVYEIYYAPSLHSENEYLCTVRCSAASVKEASSIASVNNISTNEDDWVEVKLPGGRPDEGNGYLPNQTSNNIRIYQDYYEATAEINDSEPCMSLTLRLLSLQSKGCVYVDEVYVFADPIDTDDSETQTVNPDSSTGSTLMTMLVPMLLGLAKSRSAPLHNQHSSKSIAKPERLETDSAPTTSNNPVNLADHQDKKLLKQNGAKSELTQFQVPAPVLVLDPAPAPAPDYETLRNCFSSNHVERVLEQLVSRVSRIEDICLRFEENMLKPINSMEARLQRVEQQVELLAKNSQFPVSPSCPRFESNPRNDSQLCGESESESDSEKIGSGSSDTQKPSEDTSVDVTTQLPPGLVVTAPEFSCCDEKEVNDVVEPLTKEKPKKSVSIDDALAAALAGFSSFGDNSLKSNEAPVDTNLGPNSNGKVSNSSESLEATDPEFTLEENEATESSESVKLSNGDDKVVFPVYENRETVATPKSSSTGVLEDAGDSTTTSCDGSTEIPEVIDEEAIDVHISSFDKADILKYFPENMSDPIQVVSSTNAQNRSGSMLDFESPILEVKFASMDNGSLKSPLEALLSYTGNNGIVITQETNMHTVEEEKMSANNQLVELDGDCIGEGVQQDLAPIHQETTFASLI